MSELDEILDKAVFKEGAGPNGSGGEFYIGENRDQTLEQAIEAYISKRELMAQIELWKNFEQDFYSHLPPEAMLDFDSLMSSKEAELKKLNIGDK